MVQDLADYSFLDRMVHRVAFGSRVVQDLASDLEASLFAKTYAGANADNPVFVTGLPRSGTTALLTALQTLPRVATHTYRDMPFVLSPLVWQRLSRPFRKSAVAKERAHGDGLMVSYDSPEAFEEVLWLRHWRSKYQGGRAALWSPDEASGGFSDVLRTHIRRVVAARFGQDCAEARYLSKNNANIARTAFLKKVIPGAEIVVPIRHPHTHAQSLVRQHKRFLDLHEEQPFAKAYMRDIGHFEFGALHKPIAFPEFSADAHDPGTLDYWLAYWTAAYRYLLDNAGTFLPLSYEDLCRGGEAAWAALLERVSLQPGDRLARLAEFFRQGGDKRPSDARITSTLSRRALDVYHAFLELQGK